MNNHTAPPQAFSLVEVTLALGILSFAFVALFGLIPIGLVTFATAIDATVETQIVQRVTTVARQAKFSELEKLDRYPGKTEKGEEAADFFFDEQGNEIVADSAIAAKEYIYSAAFQLQDESSVPAAGGAQAVNPNLATVVLTIRRISAPNEARNANLLIANNGL